MGYFKIEDVFIRKHARALSVYAQVVYVVLCCHANKERTTFIGQRKIAELVGISKTTVNKAMKELEAYHLLVRLIKKNDKPYQIKLLSVSDDANELYQPVVPKEDTKEFIKEAQLTYNGRERMMAALKEKSLDMYEKMKKIGKA